MNHSQLSEAAKVIISSSKVLGRNADALDSQQSLRNFKSMLTDALRDRFPDENIVVSLSKEAIAHRMIEEELLAQTSWFEIQGVIDAVRSTAPWPVYL